MGRREIGGREGNMKEKFNYWDFLVQYVPVDDKSIIN